MSYFSVSTNINLCIEDVRVSIMYFDNKESSVFFSMIIQYVIDKVLFVNFVFMIKEIN